MNIIPRCDFRRAFYSVYDLRSPMLRLLQDCNNAKSGMIEVDYAQQWRTLGKAIRLGYVDDHQRLTERGKEWLALNSSEQP